MIEITYPMGVSLADPYANFHKDSAKHVLARSLRRARSDHTVTVTSALRVSQSSLWLLDHLLDPQPLTYSTTHQSWLPKGVRH